MGHLKPKASAKAGAEKAPAEHTPDPAQPPPAVDRKGVLAVDEQGV